MIIHVRRSVAVGKEQRRSRIEAAIKTRGAHVYAGFLLPHLRPNMVVLDCGCGEATIAIGLAEAVPAGRVVGIDLETDSLGAARRYAESGGLTSPGPRPTVDDCLFTTRRSRQFFAILCLR